MNESHCWEVDRLAAHKLVASLGLQSSPELLERAAAQLAEHRRNSAAWVIDRTRSKILEVLERRAAEQLGMGTKGEAWALGVGFAEQQVASLSLDDLDDRAIQPPRTKGQILRAMLHSARASTAVVTKRRLPPY